jgi:adenylate cyclase
MKKEIERKFLVTDDAWRTAGGASLPCEQGYICSGHGMTVRVRRMGEKGFLTLKGPTEGISRTELEYEIPVDEAEHLLKNFCGGRVVSKVRTILDADGALWEIDEFTGENRGLIVAEIELESEDQLVDKPAWLGAEVSHDSRYRNAALATQPFIQWQ